MFDLVFLGTGASAPSVHRGLPAVMLMYRNHRFLIDCGEGTQRQILTSGIGFKRLNKILITHGHLDHILGLAGLISTLIRWEGTEGIDIWASTRALGRIQPMIYGIVLPGYLPPPVPIHLIDLAPETIWEDAALSVGAFRVEHRGSESFGFAFEQKARRPFLNDRAEALGVPAGPERRRLVGGEAITLADGRVVYPDQVLGPVEKGVKLVYVGDCERTDSLLEQVAGADVLVIEATYLAEDEELAREFGHLTAAQAARLAREAGVRHLILTHISRRYRERDIKAEARATFPHAQVARDFDHYVVAKDKPAIRVDRSSPPAEPENV
ncbi:MAG: ribonuclease Z [Anaerolineae bacterium]|nr:ribonuclease Z [Anaerolineae bacterium]